MSKKKGEGSCRLCGAYGKLEHSHIISKAFIKKTRNIKQGNKFYYHQTTPTKKSVQDGPKEFLLCNKCEHQFCNYEDAYVKTFLNKHRLFCSLVSEYKDLTGYNYQSTKLFFLSILWRLMVTSNDNFKIKADEKEQNTLKNMLLKNDPGQPRDFPIYGRLVYAPPELAGTICFVQNPAPMKEMNAVTFLLGGIELVMSITKENDQFIRLPILEDVKWTLPMIPIEKCPSLKSLMNN